MPNIVLQITNTVNDVADITDLYRQIHKANLDFAGASFKVKRTTLLRGVLPDKSKDNDAFMQLLSLRRSLKVSVIYCSDNYFFTYSMSFISVHLPLR